MLLFNKNILSWQLPIVKEVGAIIKKTAIMLNILAASDMSYTCSRALPSD